MMWIYDLPNWVAFLLLSAGLVIAALGGHRLWRRFFKLEYDPETSGLAMGRLGIYAATLGLLLFFLVAMDRPFTGLVSVSPEPYETALESMKRWDAE